MADEAGRPPENRHRLGRGLAALLGDANEESTANERSRGQRKAAIEFLRPNPRNPRKNFNEAELDDLAASIRERGVIQPVLVRAMPKVADVYEIIAGERRWRAAQRAGLHEVPIVVIEAGDRESLELAIVENVQRTDLNALEEAQGYARLAADFGYSHQNIAQIIGKSRSHIANTLRLLNLPEFSQGLLAEGAISAGHARALLALADPDSAARRVVEQNLSVRDVEKLSERTEAGSAGRSAKSAPGANSDARALEQSLGAALGTQVIISHRGEAGEIRIRFGSFEQLDDFCQRLSSRPLPTSGKVRAGGR